MRAGCTAHNGPTAALTPNIRLFPPRPNTRPQVELSSREVAFPPCRPGERAHQTLMLANYGDTPAAFAVTNAAALAKAGFAAKPEQGVVPAKGHVLVGWGLAVGGGW